MQVIVWLQAVIWCFGGNKVCIYMCIYMLVIMRLNSGSLGGQSLPLDGLIVAKDCTELGHWVTKIHH